MSEENKNVTTETAEATGEMAGGAAVTVAPISAELTEVLSKYGVDAATMQKIYDLGVESVDELAVMEVSDLVGAGMKLAKARKMLADLKQTAAPATPGMSMQMAQAMPQAQVDDVLPKPLDNATWLNKLRTDGVLKVGESSYIAAIRATLAHQVGLYKVPELLVNEMDAYADATDEQLGQTYFELRNMLTRRSYADLFSSIKGLNGTYITDARRKAFLDRMQEEFWPVVQVGREVLENWFEVYKADNNDISNVFAMVRGEGAMATDTSPLHDYGDRLIMAINRAFRGPGVQVAAALAYDASEILKVLENPELPMLLGLKSRELMLRKIGIDVSSSYARLEQDLVQYVMAFVKHDSVTVDAEVRYFKALWQLGVRIDWSQVGVVGGHVNKNGKPPYKGGNVPKPLHNMAGGELKL